MRRVDRLLLKVQQAERLDAMQVSVAFVERAGEKWRAIVDLWDGIDYPNGRTQRLIMDAETEAEAVAAIEEIEAAHAPTGYRAKTLDGVIIINDCPAGEPKFRTFHSAKGTFYSGIRTFHSAKGTFYSASKSQKPA